MLGKQESTDEHDDAAASIVSELVYVRGRSSCARAGVGLPTSLWLAARRRTRTPMCARTTLSRAAPMSSRSASSMSLEQVRAVSQY